jgi:cytoskeletal protein RodZ
MEENTQSKLNLGGILRLLLGVLIVAIVAFLLIRFIGGRQSNKNNQNSGQVAKQDDSDKQKDSNKSSSESNSSSRGDENTTDSNEQNSIPSGLADENTGAGSGSAEEASSDNVPATGMGSEALIGSFSVALVIFVVFEVANRPKKAIRS